MDYLQFRQTSTPGQAISVNHRALITRALTKYPVDHALFRELLQNSADAKANSATIQFETNSSDNSALSVHSIDISRLRFSNDGLDFTKDDWNRLKEIASGNPNEAKIGAFGVGFYSVFELTDEPLVHSGNKIMNFKFQGSQLQYYFTEEAPTYLKGTLIDMPYKKNNQMHDLTSFIGFLVQSFLLVNLNEIKLEIKYPNGDVKSLLHLFKTHTSSAALQFPPGLHNRSPKKYLTLSRLKKSDINIQITYLNATQSPPLTLSKGYFSFGQQLLSTFVSKPKAPEEYTSVEFNLTRVDASVDVSVSSSFKAQMVETLLKPPPKRAEMSLLLFTETLPLDMSKQVKSYIFPKEAKDAKIFIGFSTKQSTGFKSHLALPSVVPTMERTAVDLSHQFVRDWNLEMIYMAGVMARCAYEYEMKLCQIADKNGHNSQENAEFICSRFKFEASAPDTVVGNTVYHGFWNSTPEMLVLSTQGILSNSMVKVASDSVKQLLRNVPVVTNEDFSKDLISFKFVKQITPNNIAADVAASPLSLEQGVKFIEWLSSEAIHQFDESAMVILLSPLKIISESNKIIDIGSAHYFHDRSILPDEEVSEFLPDSCIPSDIASKLGHRRLNQLGITALSCNHWSNYCLKTLLHGTNTQQILVKIAKNLLKVLSKAWSRLSTKDRELIVRNLNKVKCVPAKDGLFIPSDVYINPVQLFPDLPVVSKDIELPESWLKAIGLRKSMDMSLVLKALSDKELNWSNDDLVQYLRDNQDSLTRSDREILRNGKFFQVKNQATLFKISSLYAPDPTLTRMGLLTLDLKDWSNNSRVAQVLYNLGLKRFPSPSELFSNKNSTLEAEVAVSYFLKNYHDAGYHNANIRDIRFVPTTHREILSTPNECYSDPAMEVFGEKVISPRYFTVATQLGVSKSPEITSLIRRVIESPDKYLTVKKQREDIFAYFSLNASAISREDVKKCKQTAFIPYEDKEHITWMMPRDVFLPYRGNDSAEDPYRPLLLTIRPNQTSVPFLQLLGVSDKPSAEQVIRIVLRQPSTSYNRLNSHEAYEELLCQISSSWSVVSRDPALVEAMRQSAFLIGVVRDGNSNDSEASNDKYSLYKASDLVIVDDIVIFNQFRANVVVAPQIDQLEGLYRNLGVPKLSQLLTENIKIGPFLDNEKVQAELEDRVNQRVKLFMENTNSRLKDPKKSKFTVKLVSSIDIYRQLKGYAPIRVNSSACMSPNEPYVLLVAPEKLDWLDIAVSLSKALLVSPNQDSVVILELQLSSDLSMLERKGYNVEKVRYSMAKRSQKKNVFISEQDEGTHSRGPTAPAAAAHSRPSAPAPAAAPVPAAASAAAAASAPPLPPPAMPPANRNPTQQPPSKFTPPNLGSLFKSGFNAESLASQAPQSKLIKHLGSIMGQFNGRKKAEPVENETVLNDGLSRSRPFDRTHLQGNDHIDVPTAPPPPESCGKGFDKDLRKIEVLSTGVPVFSSATRPAPNQDEIALSLSLLTLSDIYRCPRSSIHIFRDDNTRTIAFNSNGSLFFNSCVKPNTDPIIYYFTVMAHELAHNLVDSHGASHSYYSESYATRSLNGLFDYLNTNR